MVQEASKSHSPPDEKKKRRRSITGGRRNGEVPGEFCPNQNYRPSSTWANVCSDETNIVRHNAGLFVCALWVGRAAILRHFLSRCCRGCFYSLFQTYEIYFAGKFQKRKKRIKKKTFEIRKFTCASVNLTNDYQWIIGSCSRATHNRHEPPC